MTKMGQRKQPTSYDKFKADQLKNPKVKKEYDRLKPKYDKIRKSLKPVSARQAKRLMELSKLKAQLIRLCNNKSELSGEVPDWQTGYLLEDHHILGRGKNTLNVFRIIMLTRDEHTYEENHDSFERKQELLKIVKPLRLAQGFREEDYK